MGTLNLALIETDGKANLEDLAKELSKDGAVEYEPNYILRHTSTPNDPSCSQWALPKFRQPKHGKSKGAPSVVVAVIDTGIDYNHPDLQGNIWKIQERLPVMEKMMMATALWTMCTAGISVIMIMIPWTATVTELMWQVQSQLQPITINMSLE